MIKVAILTISDSCWRKERQDISGQAIKEALCPDKFEICQYKIVPDEQEEIAKQLIYFADQINADIVLTTGSTGLGPRDIAPEATAAVCNRIVPGLTEIMRLEGLKKTKNAILSRAMAGIRKNTLIINLPGSPKAALESLQIILDVLPHAVDMLAGRGH